MDRDPGGTRLSGRERTSNGRPSAETVEAIWRIESARLVARLSRLTGEVGLAEDMAQEAFIAALSTGEAGNDRDTKDKIRAAQKTEG